MYLIVLPKHEVWEQKFKVIWGTYMELIVWKPYVNIYSL